MKSALFFCLALPLVACASNETGSSNPGEGSGSTKPAEPAGPKANGTLGDWQALPDLPTPRGNHCAVATNEWLVVIGGNYKPKGASEFVTTDEVHAAHIEADGTLGEWKLAGRTPSPVSSCTAAADGATIVLVDGIYDDENDGKNIHETSIDANGDLSGWTTRGALPEGVSVLYSQAQLSGGELRAFHARLPDNGDGIAFLHGRDSLSDTTWLDGFRGHPQYVFAGAFIYALGGYAGADKQNAILADGAGAKLDDSGVPGESFNVAALPKATAFGKGIAVDDWIFVVGGKEEIMSGKGRADVFASKIDTTTGALGEWSTASSLPQGRTSHALVVWKDHLYVVGGGYDAGGLDSVFSAQVRF